MVQLKKYSAIYLEGLKKNTVYLSQDNQLSAEILTERLRI
jgi:hypothetical protein